MAFQLPEFNLECAVCFDEGGVPGTLKETAMCNLAYGRRGLASLYATPSGDPTLVWVYAEILLPSGTDVQDSSFGGSPDWLEVPLFTGRWFRVAYVDLVGAGFPNEHVLCLAYKSLTWTPPLGSIYSGTVARKEWKGRPHVRT
jgi:hypothetical protein